MKKQIYVASQWLDGAHLMVINTLGTYFKKALVNHLKSGPTGLSSGVIIF